MSRRCRSTRSVASRWARSTEFGHFSVASQGADGTVLELGVRDRSSGTDPNSDTARCLAGHVTLTLLAALGAVPPPDDPAEAVVGAAAGEGRG
jgi:hypothetical protein